MSSTEALECSVCKQPYNEEDRAPRLLSCGHTFCSCCLHNMTKDSGFCCPHEGAEILLVDGANALPKNVSLLEVVPAKREMEGDTVCYCDVCDDEKHIAESYCLDCGQAMCGDVANVHSKLRTSKHHSTVPTSKLDPTIASVAAFCAEHDQAYKYFDTECNVLICPDCLGLKFSKHRCQPLLEAATNCQNDIPNLFNEAQNRSDQLKSSMAGIVGVRHNLTANFHKASSSLEDDFQQITQSATARREKLSTKLKESFESKSRFLDEQFKQLESLQTGLLNDVEQTKKAMQAGSSVPTLLAYSNLCRTLKMPDLKKSCVHPCVDDVLRFFGDLASLTDTVRKFGSVIESGVICEATGYGLVYALPGQEGAFHVELIAEDNSAYSKTKIPFTVDIMDKVAGKLTACIQCRANGVYLVTYPGVQVVTEIVVSILVSGACIQGSPFIVRPFYEDLKNLSVVDEHWFKSDTDGHDSWAESVPLWKGEHVNIYVRCRRNEGDFYLRRRIKWDSTRDADLEVLLLENDRFLKGTLLDHGSSRIHVTAQERGSISTYSFSINFMEKTCTYSVASWRWTNSVKIRFVLRSNAEFSVNMGL